MAAHDHVQGVLPPSRRMSEVLSGMADGSVDTVGELLAHLEERAFGALLFILFFPCSIPAPPGAQTVFGVPALLVSIQLMVGRKRPWLPDRFVRLHIRGAVIAKLARRISPYVIWFERLCKPRFRAMTGRLAERVAGTVIFLLALAVLVPLPLTNNPAGAAATITALGLIEADGLVILFGLLMGLAVLGVTVWGYGFLIYMAISSIF